MISDNVNSLTEDLSDNRLIEVEWDYRGWCIYFNGLLLTIAPTKKLAKEWIVNKLV